MSRFPIAGETALPISLFIKPRSLNNPHFQYVIDNVNDNEDTSIIRTKKYPGNP